MQDDLVETLLCVDRGGVLHFRRPKQTHPVCAKAADRIAALEAENERLMGLVKEAGEALEQAHNAANLILAPICASSGRYLYDWADCPDMIAELTSEGVKIPAKDFAELYDATNYRDDILAKIKEATDAD